MHKITDHHLKITVALCLISFAVVFRLLPHPPNFAPVAAVALFGGALLPRKLALTLPLCAMLLSDLAIGLHPLILFTWGSYAAIALLGNVYFTRLSAINVAFFSIGSSVLFFVITNFGVWLEGRLYPPTIDGLVNSYINALPFFRNTLLSDMFFSAALFGSYVLVYKYAFKRNINQRPMEA